MNESFETIRKELKKFNAEDNQPPPKLLIAGKNDFPGTGHKRKKNSQFIISVKEFGKPDQQLLDAFLKNIETSSGQKPLAFLYDDKETIKTVIEDFEDYYNMKLGKEVFQKIGSSKTQDDILFYLIIVVIESYYYGS